MWSWDERSVRSGWITFFHADVVDMTHGWPARLPAPSRPFPERAKSATVVSRGSVIDSAAIGSASKRSVRRALWRRR